MIANALGFALRCHLSQDCEYNAPLTQEQHNCCDALLHAMESTNAALTAPWEGDLVPHNPLPDPLDNDDDNEDHYDNTIIPTNERDAEDGDLSTLESRMDPMTVTPSHPIGMPKKKKDVYFCPIVQPELRRLLVSIVTHLPQTAADGKWFNVFLSYIVLASIKAKGEFLPAGEITQLIAAILFGSRITIFNVMDLHVADNPTQRYEA